MKREFRQFIATIAVAALAGGCAAASQAMPARESFGLEQSRSQVIIDGRIVPIRDSHTALQLLESRMPRVRLQGVMPGAGPLVVVDGVPLLGGTSNLRDIRALDIRSVTTLRSLEASTRYGGLAANGAIVVVTKSGRR